MRRLTWLAGIWLVLVSAQAGAQPLLMNRSGEVMTLTPDALSLILHLDSPGHAGSVLQPGSGWVSGHPQAPRTANFVIVTLAAPLSGPDLLSAAAALIRPGTGVRSAALGYRLESELPVWPAHRVAYRRSSAWNPAAAAQLLQPFGPAPAAFTPSGIEYITLASPDLALACAWQLAQSGYVDWAQPDFIVFPEAANDPLFPQQFYLDNTGQTVDGASGTPDVDIDAPEAWAITLGNALTTVAVIDEGVEAHEDLETASGISRVLPGYHTSLPGGDGLPQAPEESHGVACAGLIAASHHNATGARGVAPLVQILPVYFPLDLGVSVIDLADGVNWAWQNGAQVLSNSWNLLICLPDPFPVLTQAITDAATLGRSGLGCVVAFAAGNSYLSCVAYPANHPAVLGVGAIDLTGAHAEYANFGPELDVVAPSSGGSPMIRTLDRMGANGYNTTGAGDLPDINYTRNFGGTSTATALTAGVAALIVSEFPFATGSDLRSLITQSADDWLAPGFDDTTGYGKLNAYQALTAGFSQYYLGGDELRPEAFRLPGGAAALRWAYQGTEARSWAVERREGAAFRTLSPELAAEDRSWTDPAAGDSAVWYRLRLRRADGSVRYAPPVQLDGAAQALLHCYPQPADAQIRIFMPGLRRVRLLDLQGRICLDQAAAQPAVQLDLSALPPGLYQLEAWGGGMQQRRPVLIAR